MKNRRSCGVVLPSVHSKSSSGPRGVGGALAHAARPRREPDTENSSAGERIKERDTSREPAEIRA